MKSVILNTLKSMRKNLKLDIIISLSLFFCLPVFFMVCCYIEDGVTDLHSFQIRNSDQCIYYNSSTDFSRSITENRISPQVFRSFFDQYNFVQEATVTEYDYYQDPILSENLSYYLIQKNFNSFFQFQMMSGRYFSGKELENGADVCVIEQTLRDKRGLSVGDTIQVGNTELKIIGVMKYSANAGIVLVPDTALDNDPINAQNIQGYIISARLTDAKDSARIDWKLLGLHGNPMSAQEYYERGKRFLFSRSTAIFVAGVLILAYALINLINILVNKLEQQKKNLGICIALGASYRQIFLQFFMECLLLVLSAVLLIFACEPLVSLAVRGIFNHYFGVYTFAAMMCVSVISALLISLVLFRKFKRMKVVNLVKAL